MRDAGLKLITFFITILFPLCMVAQEPAMPDSIPEEPYPAAIDIDAATEVMEVDSIIPMAPEFTDWGTSMPRVNAVKPEDTNRNWWHLFRKGN